MPETPLHIMFNLSAVMSLREGLELAGEPGKVIGLSDDLSFGPPDSSHLCARRAFVEEVLNYDFYREDAGRIQAFWRRALDHRRERIVWLSRWSTQEYCGFLEWLRRNEKRPFRLVDLTDAQLPLPNKPDKPAPVGSTALVHGETFSTHALWSRADSPSAEQIAAWMGIWARIMADDNPLRALTEDGLVAAPMDHFDDSLLTQVGPEWTDSPRVVGLTMTAMMFDSFRDGGVFQCGDLLLFSRLRAMVETGKIAADGDIWEHGFKVRENRQEP